MSNWLTASHAYKEPIRYDRRIQRISDKKRATLALARLTKITLGLLNNKGILNQDDYLCLLVAYRNVESPWLFRYEHKVFNFETRSAAGANHLSAFNQWT